LKQNAAFSLKKKDYQDILQRIKDANSALHDLTGQRCGLEPSRKYRSQSRLITLVRSLTRGIFQGLRTAESACRCARSHKAGLELEARNAVIVPTDVDNEIAKRFDFHVALSSEKTSSTQGEPPLTTWTSVYASVCATDNKLPEACVTSTLRVVAPQKTSHWTGWSKSLSFKLARDPSSSSSATQTLVEISQSLVVAPAAAPDATSTPAGTPVRISELCHVVARGPKAPAVDNYGVIADAEREFELRPPADSQPQAQTTVTLRQVLSAGKDSTLPLFAYPDKLKVAVALVVSILHLYKTPWLPRLVTLDDVVFLREDSGSSAHKPSGGYRPFIARDLSGHHHEPPQGPRGPRPVNTTVLSLAALLIQLIIGKVVDSLDMKGDMDSMESILSKYEAGSRLNGEVMTSGGMNYASAVQWCLGTVLEVAGLEDDDFCQKFYGAVVAKLEEDAKLLTR
jgi:hypothetical protein